MRPAGGPVPDTGLDRGAEVGVVGSGGGGGSHIGVRVFFLLETAGGGFFEREKNDQRKIDRVH